MAQHGIVQVAHDHTSTCSVGIAQQATTRDTITQCSTSQYVTIYDMGNLGPNAAVRNAAVSLVVTDVT